MKFSFLRIFMRKKLTIEAISFFINNIRQIFKSEIIKEMATNP